MRILLALAIVLASHAAFAFGVILTDDTAKTRIEIVDLPSSKDLFLVAWEDVPALANGAMVFYKDQGASETRFFAVGGGGPFAIVDRGRHTLISGTLVAVYDLVLRDPDHPTKLVAESGKKLDPNALLAKYATYEHVAAPNEGKPAIESAVTAAAAHANKTCGGHLGVQLLWDTFTKANKLVQAKQAIAILEAIEPLCSDKDYKGAVQALSNLRVEYKPDAQALDLKVGNATLNAVFGEASFNPRETARQWLTNHL